MFGKRYCSFLKFKNKDTIQIPQGRGHHLILRHFKFYILQIFIFCSCHLKSEDSQFESKNPLMKPLLQRREEIRKWAVKCDGVAAKETCGVGDAALFNGILCMSGEDFACTAVKRSQDTKGQFWRAPQRVGKDTSDSFSRDMALGVLGYLLVKKDTQAANLWLQAIRKNGGKLCTDATDNRCYFTPGFWNLFGLVWNNLSLTPSDEMKQDFIQNDSLQQMQGAVTPLGFELHLVAVNVLLRKFMKASNTTLQETAKTLFTRQPLNPFFGYLHEGNTKKVRDLLLQQCPQQKPKMTDQWYFERNTDDKEWKKSMGWDCIALINLLGKETVVKN